LGAETVFVGSGIFKSTDPAPRAKAIVDATTYFDDPQKLLEVSTDLAAAMEGLEIDKLPDEELMARRGW
jgi:pyridoxal 5'-phosphate synthase pdxS subunit